MRERSVILFLGVLFLIAASCSRNPAYVRLDEIESFAESHPDSARQALEAIDPAFLNTRRLKAQHALMLSTALNRCKIKVPNDSLVNIAVDYYDRFGPRKEKFLSYYYQGRVYQDLENYEAALQSYVEAESIHSKDISLRYLTSLQLKKGRIYQTYFDFDKSVDAYRKAQQFALQCNWRSNYFTALAGELAQYVIYEKTAEADSMIRILSPFCEEMGLRDRMGYDNSVLLLSLVNNTSKQDILANAQVFEQEYSALEGFPWSNLSLFYTRAGSFSDAGRALSFAKDQVNDPESDTNYLQSYGELKDSLGQIEESREARMAYQEIMGQRLYQKGVSDLRFLEERIIREKRTENLRRYLSLGIFVAVLLFGASVFGLRKRRKQKERVTELYDSLKEEYEEMNIVLRGNSSLQEEARALLGERVKSLAQFLSAEQPSSLDKVADRLESLTENRKHLLETIGLLYAVYHPAFVYRLQSSGLTNGEIGYCCLLVLGFRTGEIGDVINRSSSYHISSAIRQKVGLGPNDTNLSIFLKNLFQETET